MSEILPPLPDLSDQETESLAALAADFVTHRATQAEIDLVEQQLGRYPRGMVAAGARCVCGTPLAVVTRPLIDGKIPFPTTLYLTSPEAVKAISHLEATGVMATMNDELASDGELRGSYARAHALYLGLRHDIADRVGDSEEHIEGTSAGGMPVRVKCLHALSAQSLVMGRGANPLGDEALDLAREEFDPTVCRCALRLGK